MTLGFSQTALIFSESYPRGIGSWWVLLVETVKWAGYFVELLVFHVERKQFVERVERELQQWQRQQQQ